MTNSSRVNKYKDLREGIKGEAGISRDAVNTVTTEEQEDDFLSFINKGVSTPEKTVEDTLTEAKTFDQIRQESSEEIDNALRSVKNNVGKEAQYNTRLDILNKIRNPEKEVIHIDKMDDVSTEQFAKGYFVKPVEEEPTIPMDKPFSPKKKMTLMERLASMSPKEDVKKVEEALKQQEKSVEEPTPLNEPIKIDETNSLEDMVNMIKKRDQIEVEKALQKKQVIEEEVDEIEEVPTRASRVEKVSEEKENKMVTILNYVIIVLIVVFVILFAMIFKQIFF